MSTNFLINEEDVWDIINPEDIWLLDKLILSRYLGYKCGPVGTDVPFPDTYIVRPAINALGMGISAQTTYIEKSTDHLLPGHFWCEVFEGRHISLDFYLGKLVLAVEGVKNCKEDLVKWQKWTRVDFDYQLPDFLVPVSKKYTWINIELIENKIIEIHLRGNPDFWQNPEKPATEVIPVWPSDELNVDLYPEYEYLPDRDFETIGVRKGILVKY